MKHRIRVLGIAGKKGSGKDTLADYFVREAQFNKVAYADTLKHMVNWLFDIPLDVLWGPSEKRDTRTRTILQEFGTDFARKHDPDVWIRLFNKRVCGRYLPGEDESPCYIVVPDVRFPEEIHNLENNYTTRMVLIKRPGVENDTADTTHQHSTETLIDTFPENQFDYILNNIGTREQLIQMAQTLSQIITWDADSVRSMSSCKTHESAPTPSLKDATD